MLLIFFKSEVIIRTNSFETILTINVYETTSGEYKCDKVTHYGFAAIVNANKAGDASYHEYGTIGRLKVADGKAVLEEGAVVCPMDLDGTAEVAKIVVETGATIYTEGNYSQNDDGVANQAVSDCGAGHHDFGEKIVVDATHMYEVCKCCGYTLITVEDDLGNQTKQTKNTINGDDVIENVTPIATYATTSTITSLEAGKNYTIGEVISEPETIKADVKDDGCEHEFVGVVTTEAICTSTGVKTYTCSKCSSSYTMSLPLGRHHYVRHINAPIFNLSL